MIVISQSLWRMTLTIKVPHAYKVKGRNMKKTMVAKNLSTEDALAFDNFYDELSSGYELKAERMQARRWKKLQRENY